LSFALAAALAAALALDLVPAAPRGAAPALPRFAPRVAISPIDAVVFGGNSLPFTALVTGDQLQESRRVTWQVVGPGSIASNGLFVAPLGADSAIVAARVGGSASAVDVSIAGPPSDRSLLLISCYESDSIDVRDPVDFRRLGEVQAGPLASGIAVDAKRRIAFVAARERVFGLDLARMTATASEPISGARFSGVASIAGGLYAATDNNAGRRAAGVRIFRIDASGAPVLVGSVAAGETPEGIVAASDGKTFYVTNVNSDELMRFEASGGSARLRATATTGPRPFGVALDERHGLLFVADNDTPVLSGVRARPGLEIFNAATLARIGAPLVTGTLNSLPIGVAVDSAASRLFVTNEGDDDVVVYDLPGMRRIAVLATGRAPWSPRIDASLHRLYVPGARSNSIDVYDTRSLRRIGTRIQTCQYPTSLGIFERNSR
jgi:DNA-binding beta-propeller fold protein YncE